MKDTWQVPKLHPHQQATLFKFIQEKGLPSWAKDNEARAFAALCQKPLDWAEDALQRAHDAGYLDKRET